MISLRKLFVFAPVMLLSLTACEAKIDEAKAKERAKAYNATEVAKNYKSFDEKLELKVTKKTGDFKEDGQLYALVAVMEAAAQAEEQKDVDVEKGMFVATSMDVLLNAASSTVKGEPVLSYYAYKSSGLKIVADVKQDSDTNGLKTKASVKVSMYVHDDGKIEKADGVIKMSMEGKYSLIGVDTKDVKGTLEMSLKATYTWKKA